MKWSHGFFLGTEVDVTPTVQRELRICVLTEAPFVPESSALPGPPGSNSVAMVLGRSAYIFLTN